MTALKKKALDALKAVPTPVRLLIAIVVLLALVKAAPLLLAWVFVQMTFFTESFFVGMIALACGSVAFACLLILWTSWKTKATLFVLYVAPRETKPFMFWMLMSFYAAVLAASGTLCFVAARAAYTGHHCC